MEEVRKFKYQNNQFNNLNFIDYEDNEVNIYDCFDYYQKIDIINAMYCNSCHLTIDFEMSTYLVTGPNILIIILNRGKRIEFNVKNNFVEYLNLDKYIEYKHTGVNYKLIGVITHIEESGIGGNFIAYCLDPLTNKWDKYNDAIMIEVINFKSEVIDFAMPYVLFYQKIQK